MAWLEGAGRGARGGRFCGFSDGKRTAGGGDTTGGRGTGGDVLASDAPDARGFVGASGVRIVVDAGGATAGTGGSVRVTAKVTLAITNAETATAAMRHDRIGRDAFGAGGSSSRSR